MAMPVACFFLLLVLLALAVAQQIFSTIGTPWRPAETNHTLVSKNGDFAAGFLSSSGGKYRFVVWVNASNSRTITWYAHNSTGYTTVEADDNSSLTINVVGKLSWTVVGSNTTLLLCDGGVNLLLLNSTTTMT
ncbi:hypothetical protein E2562_006635 [Oryza meyeriana var. granulata]|uniref:Bulb-type lectin domain-containing protein n=1 Tax=Oryza meyeriana var. granulata TaxID=110450 RepID=A0A6G1EEZ9_9ORYZ|nr:hypothetical protein E2562_006635 [Oryza meyeriana var. granulata]